MSIDSRKSLGKQKIALDIWSVNFLIALSSKAKPG